LVTGVAFALLAAVVAVGAYTQRDDGVVVAVSGSDADTASNNPAPAGDTVAASVALPTSAGSDTTAPSDTVADTTVAGSTTTSAESSTTAGEAPTTAATSGVTTSSTIDSNASDSSLPSTSTPRGTTSVSAKPVCPNIDGSSPRTTSFTSAPPMCIDLKATYTATMKTSEGTMIITLDAKQAPNTVNNFVFLSRHHFYDGLTIHRVVPGFIIQGGDPLANSNGGPGYQFDDELPGNDGYDIGDIAMANSGVNTNGSQFFIVTGSTGRALKGTYSTFGKVTKGTSVLKAIDALGRPPGANAAEFPPQHTITIESVTINSAGEKKARIPGYTDTTSVSITTTVG
jgi:cyclophilin family peptidyl-prolyl cis-trans isomerase